MKICNREDDYVNIKLSGKASNINQVITFSLPIGSYTDCMVTPTCGLADEHQIIGFEDLPSNFFLPERINAKLLWTSSGWLEYTFPLPPEYQEIPKELMITFEGCSEAPNFKEDWKSDITIDSEHTIINSKITSSFCVQDLGLDLGAPVTLLIGNKDDAKYIGGFNLFGSKFGDYTLDLEISCIY